MALRQENLQPTWSYTDRNLVSKVKQTNKTKKTNKQPLNNVYQLMTTHGIIKVKVFIVGVGEEGERDKQIYRERQRNNIARIEGYKEKE